MESSQQRRPHRLASRRSEHREVRSGELTRNVDGSGRPVRPFDAGQGPGIGLPPVTPDARPPDFRNRHRSFIVEENNVGIASGSNAADKRRQPHMAGRVDTDALIGGFLIEAALDGEAHTMVRGTQLERIRSAAVVGGKSH